MRKIGIIGMGNVGSTLAHSLIVQGLFDEYVLIDTNEKKVNADVLDFKDAFEHMVSSATLTINNYEALKDADIVVSSLGNIALQRGSKDRFAELEYTSSQVKMVAKKIKESGFKGVLVVITNPVDAITTLYQKETQFPTHRVIGTGTLLDTARMKRAVGQLCKVSAKSVSGYNLGEHGNSQFTAWSQVSVKGQSIFDLTTKEERDKLNEEALMGGFTVFSGKGYTNFAIAASAVALVRAIITDSYEELPVSQYFEEYDIYLGYPAIIGRSGVINRVTLSLTPFEKEQLKQSAETIKLKCHQN